MTNEERQDHILGQVMAVSCAVKALLDTHPNPEQARAIFIAQLEATEGHALAIPVADTFMTGLEKVRAFLIEPTKAN